MMLREPFRVAFALRPDTGIDHPVAAAIADAVAPGRRRRQLERIDQLHRMQVAVANELAEMRHALGVQAEEIG